MGTSYTANDLAFTLDGDFLIGTGGDLMDTDVASINDQLAGIKQAIAHRLVVEKNGWALQPTLCAGLEQYVGQLITPALCQAMERQIQYTLTQDGLFQPSNLVVKVLDIGAGTEAVVVTVFVRGVSDKPVFVFGFDIQNGNITQVL
jgi:hypothetical protein